MQSCQPVTFKKHIIQLNEKNTRWRRAIRPLNLWNRHGKNQDEGEKKSIYLEKSPPP